MVAQVVILGGAGTVAAGIVAGAGYWLYRKRQKEHALQHIEELSADIERAMNRRRVRHPQLLQHKLDAAVERWEQGDYREAERIMEDLERLVQLS